MEGYAYYNGKIGRCNDISIPLTDRVIYFGDGIYEVIIGHSGRLFLADEHIERMFGGLEALNINADITKDKLLALIHNLIVLSGYGSYLVYICISRNADERRHSYLDSASANLLITIKEFVLEKTAPLNLITVNDERYNYCNIKTVNLLPAVIAATKAEAVGCDEAVFVKSGIITECSRSNLFIIKDGALVTHPESRLILPGITRKTLIKTAAELKISVIEKGVTVDEALNADEVIITGTTKLATEASAINGYPVGGKARDLLLLLKDALWRSYKNI